VFATPSLQRHSRHVPQSNTQQSEIHQAWPETKHRYDIDVGKEGHGTIYAK
jgi:hypothetical protein